MATFTTNYNLRKPDNVDDVEVTTDIGDNMDIIDAQVKLIADRNRSGTAFPGTGVVEGHTFYRTDEDKLYVYNGTSWIEIFPRAAYKARISKSATQNITNDTATLLTFDGTTYNVGMTVDLTAESITVTQDGVYQMFLAVTWAQDGSNGDGLYIIRIKRNGAIVGHMAFNHVGLDTATAALAQVATYVSNFLTGDIITAEVYQNSGVTTVVQSAYLAVNEIQ